MKAQEMLAETILLAKDGIARFYAGFDESNRTRQVENLPNHLMWCLGHMGYYLHVAAHEFDGKPIPPADYAAVPGDTNKYHVESITIGSTPGGNGGDYPPLERGIAVFNAACDRLAGAVREASDEQFMRDVEFFGNPTPLRQLVARVTLHIGTHTGEIVDMRRALGFDRVIM